MSKVLVVYWSGTGNTEAMAEAVAGGVRGAGGEAVVASVSSLGADGVKEYAHIAFGCPSMGAEVLEESEMEPFFTRVEQELEGKCVALFGSYDWGDGQWMRDWEDRVRAARAKLCGDGGVIANLAPDGEAIAACEKLGAALAAM